MYSKNHISPRRDWLVDIVCLAALFIVFYIFWLGSYPLFTPDEGRYSEVAREMVASGDYITPRVNGVAFLDKPVLYYWLQALAINLFGIKEWALRLFPALLGVLGCLVTYICGRHLFNRHTGIIASIILATTPLYFGSAHYANLDLEVAVLISCSLLFFITAAHADQKTQRYFFLIAYLFTAFAFLTKGLIAVAFPCMIGGIWIALMHRFDIFKKMHLSFGIVLFLAITMPWYLLVQRANPEFLHFFFVTQQVTRFLSAAAFNNPTPVWFYLPVILFGFLPWTAFLIFAAYKSIKNILDNRTQHSVELYLLLWVGIIFVFFSVPHSKTIGYILPVFPALALLVAHYLANAWEKWRLSFTLSTAATVVFLLIVTFHAGELNDRSAKPLVAELKTILTPQDEVVNYFKFYHDVPLYLEQRITLVANWNDPDIAQKDNWVRELWFGMPFQQTSDWLIDENTFWQRFNSDKRVFVFLNDNYFAQFKSHAQHYFVIGKSNDIILLSNKPTMLSKNP